MTTSALRHGVTAAVTFAGVAGVSLLLFAQTSGEPARFSATAMNLDRGGASRIDIVVSRWSSSREHDRLVSVLRDKGPDKLLDVLRDTPKVGYLQRGSNLGWDVHYARRAPLPD